MITRILVIAGAVIAGTIAQWTPTYKTCAESQICSTLRNKKANPFEFEVITESTLASNDSSITLAIRKNSSNVLQLTTSFIANDILRFQIEEFYDPNRYYLDNVLFRPPIPEETLMNWINQDEENITLIWGGGHTLVFHSQPFYIEINHQNDLVAIINEGGLLTFNHEGDDRAVAFDVTFYGANYAYGLPVHADNLVLRQTQNSDVDPYRLYNLYVDNYTTNSTQARSGTVPLLYAHGPTQTSGLFFHNGYETWVDIDYTDGNVYTHFMVEDGIFDAFILLGPTPDDVYKQYASLTGVTPLPPQWSLGYHHYALPEKNQFYVEDLVANYDANSFPLESIWITEELGTFLWDSELYPGAPEMLQNVSASNRKIVMSIIPCIVADINYWLYYDAWWRHHLVQAPFRLPYVAYTYLGLSSWWDFANPEAVDFFLRLFPYSSFPDSSPVIAGFWNVQNEPIVLNTEENSLPGGNIQYPEIHHRDVHNIYSLLMNEATYTGMNQRDDGQRRPFVLTDAFFAGTQRYAAIHTGSSIASWEHLQTSFHMCLQASLAAMSFCGTDVGGYLGDVAEDILVRWYQAAIWLPLFRANSRLPRPQLYDLSTNAQTYIKTAINLRYSLTDVFYTLFYEHQIYKNPVVKPLFYQYPSAAAASEVESGFLVGDNILVYPVYQPDVTSQTVYLSPGEIWYDIDSPLVYTGFGFTSVSVYPNRIPVFYKAGAIIPRRNELPRTTTEARASSFVVYIFLDTTQQADGRLYFDDGISFSYLNNQYYYVNIAYRDDTIYFETLGGDDSFNDYSFTVFQYLVYRPPSAIKLNVEPLSTEPEVYEFTASGTRLKDVRISGAIKQTIRLR